MNGMGNLLFLQKAGVTDKKATAAKSDETGYRRCVLRQRMYDNRPGGRSCSTNEKWSKVFVDPG